MRENDDQAWSIRREDCPNDKGSSDLRQYVLHCVYGLTLIPCSAGDDANRIRHAEAKGQLEATAYAMRKALNEVLEVVSTTIHWLESNHESSQDEYIEKRKLLEDMQAKFAVWLMSQAK